MNKPHFFTALAVGVALTLSGCGSDSPTAGGTPAATTLTGTAATGAGIVGGTVTAKCAGGEGFTTTVTTEALGKWDATLDEDADFPCAIQVSYGDPVKTLHSFATASGVVNITPLTDLALAKTLGASPSSWFAGSPDPAALIDEDDLAETISEFKATLLTQDYSVPATGNPFTTTFTANGTGWDALLDELKAAIPDYDAFLQGIAEGSLTLADIPENTTGVTNPELDGDGAALAGENGVTATFGTTSYTYTNPNVRDIYIYNPLTGGRVIVVRDALDVITHWSISGLFGTPGTYHCDSEDNTAPTIGLTLSSTLFEQGTHIATACVIEVTYLSSTEIEGRFSATLSGLGTTTNGYFRARIPQEETPTEGLQPSDYGYSLYVNGVLEKDTNMLPLNGWDLASEGQVSLGTKKNPTDQFNGHGFQLGMVPGKVSGTYACGDNGPWRTVGMTYALEWIYNNNDGFKASNATYPGSCTIVVNYADGIYSGTFSGTLFNPQGNKVEITDGHFRFDGTGHL